MLNLLLPVALSVMAGASIVVQQALIANLRIALNSSAWAGFASYFVGLLSMVVLALALRDPLPAASLTARIPW
ncbi:DMT family transporter, partial [Methylobacterium sp.]